MCGCPGVVLANAPGHDRRRNESKIGSMSPSRLAHRQTDPDIDTGTQRGTARWFLTCWIGELVEPSGPRQCYIPVRLSNLDGRRQCSLQTCKNLHIQSTGCPDPCVHTQQMPFFANYALEIGRLHFEAQLPPSVGSGFRLLLLALGMRGRSRFTCPDRGRAVGASWGARQ